MEVVDYKNEEQVAYVIKEMELLAEKPCEECEECTHCENVKLLSCLEYDLEYAKNNDKPPICVYCKFIEASRSYWSYTLKNDKPEFMCDACFEQFSEETELKE